MREYFQDALERLPELLETREWRSTFVTYEYPHVERLWIQYDDYFRLALHRILPMPEGTKALYHNHPWPSIFKVYSGDYKMMVGVSKSGEIPQPCFGFDLGPGSVYSMPTEESWHAITPTTCEILSVMMTGKPFQTPIPEKYKPPTKQLELSPARKVILRNDFLQILIY